MPDYITNLMEGSLGCLQAVSGLAWFIFSLVWLVKAYREGLVRSQHDWFWFITKRGFYFGFLLMVPYAVAWVLIASLVGVLWLWCNLGIHLFLAVLWLDMRKQRHPMDGTLCFCHPIVWPFWFSLRQMEASRGAAITSTPDSIKE